MAYYIAIHIHTPASRHHTLCQNLNWQPFPYIMYYDHRVEIIFFMSSLIAVLCIKLYQTSLNLPWHSLLKHLCLNHSRIDLETSLKHHWSTLKLWNLLFNTFEVHLKHPCNFLKTPMKQTWNTLESIAILKLLKQYWNSLKCLKQPLKLLEVSFNTLLAFLQLPWNTFNTSFNTLRTHLKLP